MGELVKGPLRQLHHHIVQRRLKAGAGLAGDVVGDLVQGIAQGQARADLRDRIAGGLRRQGRGTGNAGIDLDDRVFKALGVQRELTVAAADDAEGGDDIQRRTAQHLVLPVRQRQSRCHHDGIAGVNADRVEVLHAADGNHVAGRIAHGFKLDLLPAGHTLLDEHLGNGGKIQAVACDGRELLRGIRDAAAGAAQGIGRTDNNRVTDLRGDLQRLLHRGGGGGRNYRLSHLFQGLTEALAVLGALDALDIRAEKPYAVLLQGSVTAELHGEGQAGLAAEACQQAVRALLGNDAAQGLRGQGFEIDGIGQLLVGHNGGGVGIDKDGLDAFLPQNAAGLCARVVKLSRLPDDDRSGTDHQDLMDAPVLRHVSPPPLSSSAGSGQTGIPCHGGPRRPPDETAP